VRLFRAFRRWKSVRPHISPLNVSSTPPAISIPVTQLRVLGYRFERDKLQPSHLAIPDSPILKSRSHVLAFGRSWTCSILNDVSRLVGIQGSVVVVGAQRAILISVSPSRRTRGVKGNGPVILITGWALAPRAPKGQAIVFGQIVAGHQALFSLDLDNFDGPVACLEMRPAVRNGNRLSFARFD
jgi:hypothetical protein